jgi:hypothetical protein
MRHIATKEEIAALPHWAVAFLDAAWTTPDSDGQREPLHRFPEMQTIGQMMAINLDTAMQTPGIVDRHFTFSVTDGGGQFGQASFWNDRTYELAFDLSMIWNSRATIAVCQQCGNLHQPAKGKVARFCSPQCRLKAHRKAA